MAAICTFLISSWKRREESTYLKYIEIEGERGREKMHLVVDRWKKTKDWTLLVVNELKKLYFLFQSFASLQIKAVKTRNQNLTSRIDPTQKLARWFALGSRVRCRRQLCWCFSLSRSLSLFHSHTQKQIAFLRGYCERATTKLESGLMTTTTTTTTLIRDRLPEKIFLDQNDKSTEPRSDSKLRVKNTVLVFMIAGPPVARSVGHRPRCEY